MFFNRIFRARALERHGRQEPLDDRLQITAPHEWLIVAGLGVMFLALLAYALLGRVERAVSLEAALVFPGERHYLVAPSSGVVIDVLVRVDDTVVAGQPVAHVKASSVQYRESAILSIVDALEENEQLMGGNRGEWLQALLTANSAAGESASETEIINLHDGKVAALYLTPGQGVSAGAPVALVRTVTAGLPEVVTFVSPDDATRISAGMEAYASLGKPGSGGSVFPGRVAEVSARGEALPQWLSDLGLPMARQSQLVRVALSGDRLEVSPINDGADASLRIVMGRQSFASLLAPGSGG